MGHGWAFGSIVILVEVGFRSDQGTGATQMVVISDSKQATAMSFGVFVVPVHPTQSFFALTTAATRKLNSGEPEVDLVIPFEVAI